MFCFFLIANSAEPDLASLIEGEWSVFSRTDFTNPKAMPLYTVEFHFAPSTMRLEGTLWLEETKGVYLEAPLFDDCLLSSFRILPVAPMTYSITTLDEEHITQIELKVDSDSTLATSGKLNDKQSFQLANFNGTFANIYITTKGESSVENYIITKSHIEAVQQSSSGKFKLFAMIVVVVIVLEALLFICCKCCNFGGSTDIDAEGSDSAQPKSALQKGKVKTN